VALGFLLPLLLPAAARGWVSEFVEHADVEVAVAADGAAETVVGTHRVVTAGRLTEYTIHGIPADTVIDFERSWVEDDRARRLPVELIGRRRPDGTVRIGLSGNAAIARGPATTRLVLRDSWTETGRLRPREDGRLDVTWTPPVFPEGMERLTVRIRFEGETDLAYAVAADRVTEWEPASEGGVLVLSRFRPPALYTMPVRLTVSRGAGDAGDAPAIASSLPSPRTRVHRSRPPESTRRTRSEAILFGFPLLGLVLLATKSRHAGRTAREAGGVQPYLLFPSLGAPLRWPAVTLALAIGAVLLADDRLLPGAALHAFAVLLAVPDRFRWIDRRPVGAGPWRPLAAPHPRTWKAIVASHRRRRRAVVDAGGPTGALLAALVLALVAVAAWLLRTDLRSASIVAADGLILLLVPFLAAPERALPPVLPAASGLALERVRRALAQRGDTGGLRPEFLVQDDAEGHPADFRLRLRRSPSQPVRAAEVATEWRSTGWGWHATWAVLVHLPAGSAVTLAPGRLPDDITLRLAPSLGLETWIARAPTPRSAAARVVELLRAADEAMTAETADAPPARPPRDSTSRIPAVPPAPPQPVPAVLGPAAAG
jgi:hypothetical protein